MTEIYRCGWRVDDLVDDGGLSQILSCGVAAIAWTLSTLRVALQREKSDG